MSASVSLQRVWVERSGAARGDPDVAAPVPVSAVQCCSLPTASLLRRQQDQSRGLCARACVSISLRLGVLRMVSHKRVSLRNRVNILK